ncbi:MAG: hypothetical protein F6K04_05225 [Leptolyngbya sp. SIO4C5]|nr:hypothetical protein [Leptolyngbya sp. SIO4C5]
MVVQSGSSVGIVPPKKRKKGEKKNAYTNRRPGSSDRPRSPRSATPKPQKPSLRRSRSEEE